MYISGPCRPQGLFLKYLCNWGRWDIQRLQGQRRLTQGMKRIYCKAGMVVAIVGLALVSAAAAFAVDQTSESPVELVRQTVQREIAPGGGQGKAIFQDRKQTPQGSQTKLIVETREGMAGMTIAINGKPLTAEQREAEQGRLSRLASNPEALKKKQKSEKEDEEHTIRIMKALPDAFLYEPDGTMPGSQDTGKTGDQLVRLKFRPNPKYIPPPTWNRC